MRVLLRYINNNSIATERFEDSIVPRESLLYPFLSSDVPVEKDKSGAYILDVSEISSDIKDTHFAAYIAYLQGRVPFMDDEGMMLFDFLGHPNVFQYPASFWGVKLHDNWVRNNFYAKKLYENPMYDLTKFIPGNTDEYEKRREEVIFILKDILNLDEPTDFLGKGIYIAGGAALYVAGVIDYLNDIDMFITSRDTYKKLVREFEGLDLNITDNSITIDFRYEHSIQIIRRLYTCPSEIVHGFDLDCVGMLFDGKDCWMTKRTTYSILNKVNWFDPQRASPTYGYRLCKYARRGFQIELPLFTKDMLNQEAINNEFKSIEFTYLNQLDKYIRIGFVKESKRVLQSIYKKYQLSTESRAMFVDQDILDYIPDQAKSYLQYSIQKIIDNRKEKGLDVQNWDIHGYLNAYIGGGSFPDAVSNILMAKFYNFYSHQNSVVSDYEYSKDKIPKYMDVKKNNIQDLENLSLMEQDPMKQLTGTFFPEPIDTEEDLLNWYRSTPFVIGHEKSSESLEVIATRVQNINFDDERSYDRSDDELSDDE